MQRRVFITGASGFIGGALAKRFQQLGWTVLGTGRRQLQQQHYVSHDLAQPIPKHLESDFDVVIHAAARSNPWGTRSQYMAANVVATHNVIDFCNRIGQPKLIYLSSSSVYYRNEHQWDIREETELPRKFVNLYAETKRLGELEVDAYSGKWSVLRPRAVFGPGDTVLLPRIVEAAKQGRLPMLTNRDGDVVGDLIYIENLIDCIETVASNESLTGTFNLTNDEPVPIHEFLFDVFDRLSIPRPKRKVSASTAMRLAWGLELFHRIALPRREPAITRFGVHVFRYSKTFDVHKMKEKIGSPRVNLDEAKRLTTEWFLKQLRDK